VAVDVGPSFSKKFKGIGLSLVAGCEHIPHLANCNVTSEVAKRIFGILVTVNAR
jgi:hypothetical protein